MLDEGHDGVIEECEENYLTDEKDVVNQRLDEIPDITTGEIKLALRKKITKLQVKTMLYLTQLKSVMSACSQN